MDLNVISWDELLLNAANNNAYLIKSDCEGAEKYLPDSDPALISKIPNYIIEIHTKEDKMNIDSVFSELGYKTDSIMKVTDQISINMYSRCCPV